MKNFFTEVKTFLFLFRISTPAFRLILLDRFLNRSLNKEVCMKNILIAMIALTMTASLTGCLNMENDKPHTSQQSSTRPATEDANTNQQQNTPSDNVTSTTLNNTSTTIPTSGGQSNVVTTTTTLQQLPPQTDCEVVPQLQFPGTISMANNLTITKDSQVKLNIFRDEASSMKISYNDTCTCGTWEPYATEKVINVANLNSVNKVSVQFKDYDDSPSVCTSVSYIHDSSAPQLSLTRIPGSLILGSTISFTVQASDNLSGLDHFTCLLNDQPYNCSGLTINTQAGGLTTFNGQLDFPNLPVNVYVAKVIAYDKLGNSVEAKHAFEIVPASYNISQDMIVKQNKNMVDILFVVDNSGSMSYEKSSMDQRIGHFMAMVADMDYHIAVTTTDPRNSVYGDGNLVNFYNTSLKYITLASMNLTEAQTILGKTLKRTETGASDEQGIYATYRAIERAKTAGSPNSQFFRANASLAVVLISDEDESATGPKNLAGSLITLVRSTWPGKSFSFHSIITKPGDVACKNGQGYTYGTKYADLSNLLGVGTIGGSIIGSVCATDYAAQLSGIGQSVQDMAYTSPLNCQPSGDVHSSVEIFYQGTKYTGGYEVQGTKIVFNQQLSDGTYTLNYTCPRQ
jgi:hypothetical protein